MIYWDNAATTPVYTQIQGEFMQNMNSFFYNPSSPYREAKSLSEQITKIKKDILDLLQFNPISTSDLFFTSGATESNNWVVSQFIHDANNILYFKGDHPSTVQSVEYFGIKKNLINTKFEIEKLKEIQNKNEIDLIVLTSVNNQTGEIINDEVFNFIKSNFTNAKIIVDHVQGIAKIKLNYLSKVDAVVFTAHKIGGPKGIGALYLRDASKISAFLRGGDQQLGLRPGTLNYPLISAFHTAIKLSLKYHESQLEIISNEVTKFKNAILAESHLFSFPFVDHSPFILCGIINKIPSDVFIRHLEQRGILISSTSACSTKIKAFNPTLSALGLLENVHKHVFRISFFYNQDLEEFNKGLEAIKDFLNSTKFLIK